MIVKIEYNSTYLDKLEEYFTSVLTKNNVNNDLQNNVFTNYYAFIVDDDPIAFINYYVMYERCELININVLEKYQNNKIASKLLEFMINDCLSNGVKSISLEVKKTNYKAIHIYEKYGFKKVSIRKEYYQGIDGILMEKELI